jgi:hypothetical protein
MARRPTPPERPHLTIEQKRRRIASLMDCIRSLEQFDPQRVQKRYGIPEVMALEAAINQALAEAFGEDTQTFNRFKRAASLDNGPHQVRMGNAFGRGPTIDYDARDAQEARKYLAEGKDQSIALLREAIRVLEREIADEEPSVLARPAREAMRQSNSQSMTDGELRHNLLSHFYRLRHSNGGYVPVDDMIVTGNPVTLESVREHHLELHSFRVMRRMEASLRKASALRLRHSQSLASLRHRPSQAKVRSTIHRLGKTTKRWA